MEGKACRVCLDVDESVSKLISPCKCKGSALYIHKHCLEHWQYISLKNKNLQQALICQICHSFYWQSSWKKLLYFVIYQFILYATEYAFSIGDYVFETFILQPIKLSLYTFLIMVTLPWGQFSLGNNTSVAWVGNDFPPQLAIVYTGGPVANLKPLCILVASPRIPDSSVFHRAVVLILEHSVHHGTRGVVINMDKVPKTLTTMFDTSMNQSEASLQAHRVGFGGPHDHRQVTVIHDCLELFHESDIVCESEMIFISEYDSALRTLTKLSKREAQRLMRLCKSTAMKAKSKFNAYANRAKRSIQSSLNEAISKTLTKTQTVVEKVSKATKSSSVREILEAGTRLIEKHNRRRAMDDTLFADDHHGDYEGEDELESERKRYFSSGGAGSTSGRSLNIAQNSMETEIGLRHRRVSRSHLGGNEGPNIPFTSNLNRSGSGSLQDARESNQNEANISTNRRRNIRNNAVISGTSLTLTLSNSNLLESVDSGPSDLTISDGSATVDIDKGLRDSLRGYSGHFSDGSTNPRGQRTHIRVVRGFTQWLPGQLEGEIREGLWSILPLKHDYVFPETRRQWWSNLYDVCNKLQPSM